MKLEVLQENIKRALAVVLPAVATKSTLPVLHNVLLTADDNGLMLAGTNLETSITTRVGAKVETHGATTIPAKLLSDLINGLPNVLVTFELDDRTQTTTIKADKFSTAIKGIEADEYPALVTTQSDPLFSMPSADWAIVADQVAMCASAEIGRAVLQGVHIISKDGLTFEAADGFRLARKRFNLEPTAAIDTIIPAISLAMVRSVFRDSDEEVSFSIVNNGGLAVFRSESATLTSRVIDGNYPNCDRIIPTTYTSRLVVPASDLAARVKLAKYVAVTSANIVRLDLTVLEDQEGRLAIGANAAEVADLKDAVDVLATGKDATIALNVKLLSDAVSACSGGDIAIELQSPQYPAVLRAVGDDSMVQLVMPMTVR